MGSNFDYFIVFAEMRTGSNFLESNLNALDGVNCHGEAFNPHFIGYPNRTDVLGVSQPERDDDPARLIDAIRNGPGVLNGFRYFHDHDPRVLELALEDVRCAKIILTRNPLDSYVSWKIARETGQWKLTNIKRRREAQARFDSTEFTDYVGKLQEFQIVLLNRLQRSGQTPFYLSYEDLDQLDVINGLAKWLGVESRLERLNQSLTRQNPAPVLSKVTNPDDMKAALADLDPLNLSRTPNFEPRRGPAVPNYIAGIETPLMYLPMRGGPEDEVRRWLADLDRADTEALVTNRNRKQVRKWMRTHPQHRKFTVLRHPLARAHSAFCQRILPKGPGSYSKIRNLLRKQFKAPIPAEDPGKNYSLSQHRDAFAGFLEFLRLNLAGQTAARVDGLWCSQSQALSGFAEFALPDHVIREEDMASDLPDLARKLGHPAPPTPAAATPDTPFELDQIYDEDLEKMAAEIYRRDYLQLGFGRWRPV